MFDRDGGWDLDGGQGKRHWPALTKVAWVQPALRTDRFSHCFLDKLDREKYNSASQAELFLIQIRGRQAKTELLLNFAGVAIN